MVLFHDSTLKRMAGIEKSVKSMTWDELKDIDVGTRFSGEFKGNHDPDAGRGAGIFAGTPEAEYRNKVYGRIQRPS